MILGVRLPWWCALSPTRLAPSAASSRLEDEARHPAISGVPHCTP